MRKSIFEESKNLSLNYNQEVARIETLFSEETTIGIYDQLSYGSYPQFTIEQYVNERAFREWKHRERFLNIHDMRTALHIDKNDLKKEVSLDTILTYLEFIYNMIALQEKHFNEQNFFYSNPKCLKFLVENIENILDKLNYEIVPEGEDDDDLRYMIVSKNSVANAVSNKYEEIRYKVIEYNKFSLKGNNERKKEILLALGDKFEPMRQKLEGGGYTSVAGNAGFLLNSINIRHNNSEGGKRNEFAATITPNEQEKWYDVTYDVLLHAFLCSDYIDKKKEIEELKQTIKQ